MLERYSLGAGQIGGAATISTTGASVRAGTFTHALDADIGAVCVQCQATTNSVLRFAFSDTATPALRMKVKTPVMATGQTVRAFWSILTNAASTIGRFYSSYATSTTNTLWFQSALGGSAIALGTVTSAAWIEIAAKFTIATTTTGEAHFQVFDADGTQVGVDIDQTGINLGTALVGNSDFGVMNGTYAENPAFRFSGLQILTNATTYIPAWPTPIVSTQSVGMVPLGELRQSDLDVPPWDDLTLIEFFGEPTTATLDGTLPVTTGSLTGTSSNPATITGALPTVSGSIATVGATAATLSGSTPVASGNFIVTAINVATLNGSAPVTSGAITGTATNPTSLASIMPRITGTISGTSSNPATVAGAVPILTGSATVQSSIAASLAGSVPKATGAITATTTNTGSLAGSVPTIAGAASATSSNPATLAGKVPVVTGTLTGTATNPAGLGGTLPKVTGSITQQTAIAATLTGTVPVVAGTFTGASLNPALLAGHTPPIVGGITGGSRNPAVLSGIVPQMWGEIPASMLNAAILDAQLPLAGALLRVAIQWPDVTVDFGAPSTNTSIIGSPSGSQLDVGVTPDGLGAVPAGNPFTFGQPSSSSFTFSQPSQ